MKRYMFVALVGVLSLLVVVGCAKKAVKTTTDQYSVIEEKAKAPEKRVNPYAYQKFTAAQQAFDTGNYGEAIKLWNEVLEMGPTNFPYTYDTHVRLGLAYFKSGAVPLAIEQFKEAVKLDPTKVEGHYNLGNAYLRQGAYQSAIIELKKAIAIKPDIAEAYLNLGVAYINQNRYREAIDVLNRGSLLADAKLRESFTKNIEIAYKQWGAALMMFGMEDEALQKLQTAIELDPKDSATYLLLAKFYLERGDYDRAVLLYQKAYEADPEKAKERGKKLVPYTAGNEARSLKMARLYESKGKLKEALRHYIAAVGANPDNSKLYLKIGDLYYKTGDEKKAIEWYHKFLVRWPSDPMSIEIEQHIARLKGPRSKGPVKVVGAWAGIGYDPDTFTIQGASDRFPAGTRVYRLCLIDNFFGEHKILRRLFRPDGSVHYEELIEREFFIDRVPLISHDVLSRRGLWKQIWIIDDNIQAEVTFEIY